MSYGNNYARAHYRYGCQDVWLGGKDGEIQVYSQDVYRGRACRLYACTYGVAIAHVLQMIESNYPIRTRWTRINFSSIPCVQCSSPTLNGFGFS
jgi:hypothetical protein